MHTYNGFSDALNIFTRGNGNITRDRVAGIRKKDEPGGKSINQIMKYKILLVF